MYGGTAGDVLYGGAGFDNLFGDEGNDVLSGDAAADFLTGGEGNDDLYGGDGGDVFVINLVWDGAAFTSSDGDDTVYDFDFLNDNDVVTFIIQDESGGVSDTDAFNALNDAAVVTDAGGDTLIQVGGASINLLGITAGAAPFNFDSLETINDYTDGNYLYEAIDVIIV